MILPPVSPPNKNRPPLLVLEDNQLATVSGGCRDCRVQLNAPSTLSAFAPSNHSGLAPLASMPDYLQPPSYFNLL